MTTLPLLGLLIATATFVLFFQIAYGFTGANITDSQSRIAIIQEEDFSISVYETINGTTEQIAAFDDDNIDGNDDGLNKQLLQLQKAIHQLTVTIKELVQTLQTLLSISQQGFTPVYASIAAANDDSTTTMQINNPASDKNAQITFNATFLNGTTALYNGNQTEEKTNILINLINGVVDGTIDYDALEELVPLPEEEEIEETEEEDNGGNNGGGNEEPEPQEPQEPEQPDPGPDEPDPDPEPQPENATCMIEPYCPGGTEVPAEPI